MTLARTSPAFVGTQIQRGREGLELATHELRVAVEAGPDRGATCDVAGTRIVIGSASDCDLRLGDPTVSRRHCEIHVEPRGYVLRDLDSRNGTLLASALVREAVLLPGATFQVGSNVITFQPRRRWETVPPSEEARFGGLLGETLVMRTLFALLGRIAPTKLSVLFVGETGTGKEVAARSLHEASERAGGPFVVFDCAATTTSLVEAELFGHERGAFTGAQDARAGVFEQAHGGTLFLDEIGELAPELQPKLLRALDRGEVKRLGSNEHVRVDVRVVAATHRSLEGEDCRDDLFYRIAEAVVELPPLRSRVADIPLLARHFIETAERADGGRVELAPEAMQWLMGQPWPGNARELRNTVRRALAFAQGNRITRDDLEGAVASAGAVGPGASDLLKLPLRDAREQWLAPMEKKYLEELLERCDGNMDRAAVESGMHRKSLLRLLRRHKLRDD